MVARAVEPSLTNNTQMMMTYDHGGQISPLAQAAFVGQMGRLARHTLITDHIILITDKKNLSNHRRENIL
jgi:hypothetical protein